MSGNRQAEPVGTQLPSPEAAGAPAGLLLPCASRAQEWSPQGLILLSWLGEGVAPVTDEGGSENANEEHQSPRLSRTPCISQIESVHII